MELKKKKKISLSQDMTITTLFSLFYHKNALNLQYRALWNFGFISHIRASSIYMWRTSNAYSFHSAKKIKMSSVAKLN